MHKSTVVNTLKLTGELALHSEVDDTGLQALIDSVNRFQPDQGKYSDTIDLDGVLTWLVEDNEETSHRKLRSSSHYSDARGKARHGR